MTGIWNCLKQSYLFTHEYAIDRDGNPGLFEINPRTDGTVVGTLDSGVNLLLENIKLSLGLPIPKYKINYNVEMLRYWSEIRLRNGKIIK